MITKIIIVWLAIIIMGCFWLTTVPGSELVDMAVVPGVPGEDKPIIATFKLNNPTSDATTVGYTFYANEELMLSGASTIAPHSSKKYQYVYKNPLKLGQERVDFVVRAETDGRLCEKIVSHSSHTPQMISSFVSFASVSTSSVGIMASSAGYESSFGSGEGRNAGIVISMFLIMLLIFFELSEPLMAERIHVVLGGLRVRFSMLTSILFIIFMSIVYTKIVMVLAS
jgi:hypothetical protein